MGKVKKGGQGRSDVRKFLNTFQYDRTTESVHPVIAALGFFFLMTFSVTALGTSYNLFVVICKFFFVDSVYTTAFPFPSSIQI